LFVEYDSAVALSKSAGAVAMPVCATPTTLCRWRVTAVACEGLESGWAHAQDLPAHVRERAAPDDGPRSAGVHLHRESWAGTRKRGTGEEDLRPPRHRAAPRERRGIPRGAAPQGAQELAALHSGAGQH